MSLCDGLKLQHPHTWRLKLKGPPDTPLYQLHTSSPKAPAHKLETRPKPSAVERLRTMAFIDESAWESFALDILGELSWQPLHGTQIAPNAQGEKDINGRRPYHHLREKNNALEIPGMLREAIARLNPALTPEHINTVTNTLLTAQSEDPAAENREAHKHLTTGYRGLTITRPDENRKKHLQQIR